MSLGLPFVEKISDLRKAQAAFSEVKRLFDLFASKPVYIGDGNKKTAIEEAQKLVRIAAEHHVTISLAIEELLHPATRQEELDRLIKHADDHNSELGKAVDEIKALVGAELEVLLEVLKEAEAAK